MLVSTSCLAHFHMYLITSVIMQLAGQDTAGASTVCFVLIQPSYPLSASPLNHTNKLYSRPKWRSSLPKSFIHTFPSLQATRQALPPGSKLPSFTLQAVETATHSSTQPSFHSSPTHPVKADSSPESDPPSLPQSQTGTPSQDWTEPSFDTQTLRNRNTHGISNGHAVPIADRRVHDRGGDVNRLKDTAQCSVDESGSSVTIKVVLPDGVTVTVQSTSSSSTHAVPWGYGEGSSPEELLGLLAPLLRLRQVGFSQWFQKIQGCCQQINSGKIVVAHSATL